jgi:zinc/manganese transport system substrate-binding protein
MTSLSWAKIPVVASFSILGDIVHQVGQDRVDVRVIVGPEKDAHTFQPSPKDVKKLTGVQLVLMNGLGFEGWLPRMVNASGYRGKTINLTEKFSGLLQAHDCHDKHHHHHEHGKIDPHVWQDPILVKDYVERIAQALTEVDPEGKAQYYANAKSYQAQLEALNQWAKTLLAVIPINKRKVITLHDAFAYLGKRYQIQFLAPQGISVDSEASAKSVADLIRQIRASGVKALFVENINNPKLMEMLAKEAKVKVGGRLYSDALASKAPANTYMGMYRHNIEVLLAGLKQN